MREGLDLQLDVSLYLKKLLEGDRLDRSFDLTWYVMVPLKIFSRELQSLYRRELEFVRNDDARISTYCNRDWRT